MSPLLFNIFLSDLAKKFESLNGKFDLGTCSINSLFWADDLVMFAKNEDKLKEMLNILEDYCSKNELAVNTTKTKCMVFNKTGRLYRNKFYLDGVLLENIRSYKYLGFLVTPSGELNSGIKDLRDRAFKAFMKLRNDLGVSFNSDIPSSLMLIDTLIKPILLYASDFWGCFKLPHYNHVDNLHMMMCKQLLGVHRLTTNVGVLLESGRVPLLLYASKNAIQNWERIKRGEANQLLLASYSDSIGQELPWIDNIKSTLEKNGMLSFYLGDFSDKHPFISKRLFERLVDTFHQNAFATIKSEKSKLRTYAIFKTSAGFEKYLYEVKNMATRTAVSKLRLSNHCLAIETGRYNNTDEPFRFCPFCPNKIENEFHFLAECRAYRYVRENLIHLNPDSHQLTTEEKLIELLADIKPDTCSYIKNCFELRTWLLNKHKRTC